MSSRRSRKKSDQKKDRLIQARVASHLEHILKDEAAKRRLSVSHLIRNVLEDTFELVDSVVDNVDSLVTDSIDLADAVRRDAADIAKKTRDAAAGLAGDPTPQEGSEAPSDPEPGAFVPSEPPPRERPDLSHILAWNGVTLNRDATCADCGCALGKGDAGHMGISAEPGHTPAWLCDTCLANLG